MAARRSRATRSSRRPLEGLEGTTVWRNHRPRHSRPSMMGAGQGSQAALWLGLWRGFGAAAAGGDPAASPLRIEPPRVVLEGAGVRQQLAITFCHDDGSPRDVTRECRFAVEPAGIATVAPDGVVRPV